MYKTLSMNFRNLSKSTHSMLRKFSTGLWLLMDVEGIAGFGIQKDSL